jgi:hypothetical protein
MKRLSIEDIRDEAERVKDDLDLQYRDRNLVAARTAIKVLLRRLEVRLERTTASAPEAERKRIKRPMTNYRKAKTGDVPCSICIYYRSPRAGEMMGRCNWGEYLYQKTAVGKNNTCDAAFKAESPILESDK